VADLGLSQGGGRIFPLLLPLLLSLRTIAECFAHLSHGLGVRLSVTLLYCVKTVQARITKFLLWAAMGV